MAVKNKFDNFAFRSTLVYVLVAGLWISSSDWLLGILISDPKLMALIGMLKGWLFIAVTATILFFQLKREWNIILQQEARIRSSEKHLQLVVNHSPNIVYIQDKNLYYTWIANPPINLDETFFIGRRDEDIFSPEQAAQLIQLKKKVLESGESQKSDNSIYMADGDLYYEWILEPYLNDNGQIDGLIGYGYDVTERKRTEEQLKRTMDSLQELAVIVNASPAVAFRWKAEKGWPVEFVSENVHQFGYSAGELVGGSISYLSLLHPADRSRIEREVVDYVQNGVLEFSQRYRIYTRSGELRWLDDHHWVLQDEKTKVTYHQGIVLDITEKKKAEDELQHLNAELEERVEARTAQLQETLRELEAFSYSVSHDLRAPLRTIDGMGKILQEDFSEALGKDGNHYLERVRNASQHMEQLIEALLRLSRVARGELNRVEVNLSELATAVIEELFSSRTNVSWKIEAELIVNADPTLMRIMLANLLGNAYKFTGQKDRAEIELGMEDQKGKKVYFVRDNGVGFDMTYANKLFGAFQRLHKTSEFEGTGIGLAIVQRIIRRHGGEIWANAAVDQGAIFYFYLD
jgi:PAS domain S-box-containing protein